MGTSTAQRTQEETQGSIFDSGKGYVNQPKTKQDTGSFSSELQTIFLASDLGGSYSRTFQLHRNINPSDDDLITVPSSYAILDEDTNTSVIKASSNDIMDNLELIIRESETSPYVKTSWFQEPQHILKGSLLELSNEVKSSINNQHDKTMDIGIFVNHLTNIAIAAYKSKLSKVAVRTSFTLPVKERYSSVERMNLLTSFIAGNYTIEMPRIGFSLEVQIEAKDIHIESEAETSYIYMLSSSGGNPDILNYASQDIVINDVGKTTYNLVLVSKGVTQSGKSHTGKFGGDNLQSALYVRLGRIRTEAISFEQAGHALETGSLIIGSETVAVGDIVTEVKKEFAKTMIKEYVEFLQNSFMQSTQVYANIFVGRTMGHTGEMYEDGKVSPDFSPSLGQLFIDQFKKLSGTTEGYILASPGVANILGLTIMMKSQWEL